MSRFSPALQLFPSGRQRHHPFHGWGTFRHPKQCGTHLGRVQDEHSAKQDSHLKAREVEDFFQNLILHSTAKLLQRVATERSPGIVRGLMWAPGHPHIFPVQGGMLGAVSISASLCAGEPRDEASSRKVGMGHPLTLPPVFSQTPARTTTASTARCARWTTTTRPCACARTPPAARPPPESSRR